MLLWYIWVNRACEELQCKNSLKCWNVDEPLCATTPQVFSFHPVLKMQMEQHWVGSGSLPHAEVVCMCWGMGRACVCWGSSKICGTQTRRVLQPFVLELGRVDSGTVKSRPLTPIGASQHGFCFRESTCSQSEFASKQRFTSLTDKHKLKVRRDKETHF